jgi:putative FmdB family regulatory protein
LPHYEYECTQCGHHFEVFQRMSDPKLEICPQCGGKIERLIGPGAGIVFKGSGFYQTDYRSQDYQKKAKSEAGTSSPSPSKPAESQKSGDSAPKPAPSAPEPSKPSKDEAAPKSKKNPEKPAGA